MDNTEIERKFLIAYPCGELLSAASRTDIVQTYLLSEKGHTLRVRKRGAPGAWTYTRTEKIRISDLRRTELENEISEREYARLLETADPSRKTVYKTRYCLPYGGLLLEIDVYPFWSDRAVLEVELEDERQDISFPPSIRLLREISHDRRYTNASLALCVPHDKL